MDFAYVKLQAIGRAHNDVVAPRDDYWADVRTEINIDGSRFGADSLAGLEDFSHLEVVFYFHLVDEAKIVSGARHPRNRTDWPKVGIFAQRGKNRPNRIGVSRCRLLGVNGLTLTVAGLDVVDGTPILDIKPWMREFGPQEETTQPDWSREIMRVYYSEGGVSGD